MEAGPGRERRRGLLQDLDAAAEGPDAAAAGPGGSRAAKGRSRRLQTLRGLKDKLKHKRRTSARATADSQREEKENVVVPDPGPPAEDQESAPLAAAPPRPLRAAEVSEVSARVLGGPAAGAPGEAVPTAWGTAAGPPAHEPPERPGPGPEAEETGTETAAEAAPSAADGGGAAAADRGAEGEPPAPGPEEGKGQEGEGPGEDGEGSTPDAGALLDEGGPEPYLDDMTNLQSPAFVPAGKASAGSSPLVAATADELQARDWSLDPGAASPPSRENVVRNLSTLQEHVWEVEDLEPEPSGPDAADAAAALNESFSPRLGQPPLLDRPRGSFDGLATMDSLPPDLPPDPDDPEAADPGFPPVVHAGDGVVDSVLVVASPQGLLPGEQLRDIDEEYSEDEEAEAWESASITEDDIQEAIDSPRETEDGGFRAERPSSSRRVKQLPTVAKQPRPPAGGPLGADIEPRSAPFKKPHIPKLNTALVSTLAEEEQAPQPAQTAEPGWATKVAVVEEGPDGQSSIVSRISQLDQGKQEWLMKVLDNLEKYNPTVETPGRMFRSEATSRGGPELAKDFAETHLNFRLRILSSWGGSRQVGLTGLSFFDSVGKPVRPQAITTRHDAKSGLHHLLDGVAQTTSMRHMWVGVLPGDRSPIDIECWFEDTDLRLSRAKIWNYNQSLTTISMGVKDCEVHWDGELVWKGVVKKGCGNAIFDYGYEVRVDHDEDEGEGGGEEGELEATFAVPTEEAEGPRAAEGRTGDEALAQAPPAEEDRATEAPAERLVDQPLVDLAPDPSLPDVSGIELDLFDAPEQAGDPAAPDGEYEEQLRRIEAQETPSWISNLRDEHQPDPHEAETEAAATANARVITEGRRAATEPGGAASDAAVADADSAEPVQLEDAPFEAKPRGNARGRKRDQLLQSFDSLANFEKTQLGRLPSARGPLPPQLEPVPDLDGPPDALDAMLQAGGHAESPEAVAAAAGLTSSPLMPEESISPLTADAVAERYPPVAAVPATPEGTLLEFWLLSTWGDMHYIGLSGIEVFDADGQWVEVAEHEFECSPQSVNVLEGYANDPRIPEKLFDGVNFTCDDMHTWLAPFVAGKEHKVSIKFKAPVRLGLVRIWNYNKSRIHAARGVKQVKVTLDREPIFSGELKRGPGNLLDRDAAVLEIDFDLGAEARRRVDAHELGGGEAEDEEAAAALLPPSKALERPSVDVIPSTELADAGPGPAPHGGGARGPQPLASAAVHTLRLEFWESWGDRHFVGLTGLAVLDAKGQAVALRRPDLQAEPQDLNDLPGCSGDDRTLDKLVDGTNVTADDSHMWLAPIPNNGKPNTLTIALRDISEISGLRLWNYNKSLDDTARGVKVVKVFADDQEVTPPGGVIVCKAPGTSHYDFGHTLPNLFAAAPAAGAGAGGGPPGHHGDPWLNSLPPGAEGEFRRAFRTRHVEALLPQDFVPPLLPCGFVLKVVAYSTWGDPYYVGLTGLEVVDALRGPVRSAAADVHGDSVNGMPGSEGDVRTVDKLVDGVTDPGRTAHSWLAPFTPGAAHAVTVHHPRPVVIAALRFWNYARTPERGAQEVEVYLDDRLIYHGYLKKFAPGPAGGADFRQSILFTNAQDTITAERPFVYSHAAETELSTSDGPKGPGGLDEVLAERPPTAVGHR